MLLLAGKAPMSSQLQLQTPFLRPKGAHLRELPLYVVEILECILKIAFEI